MGSANKNTDKGKETRSKLEQEIYDALNSEPEFKEPLDSDLSPLNEPVEEIPPVNNEYYFEELCNWLSNGYQQLFHEIHTKEDYVIRHAFFPPEQTIKSKNTEKKIEKKAWKPISETELELQPERAQDRLFDKSPQHHVFLITLLEAAVIDTANFINAYAAWTNKTIELEGDTGKQKCMELLIRDLEIYLEREDAQLLPVLYSNIDYGLSLSADLENLDTNADEDVPVFEYGFSKATSDAFTSQLITLLKEKLAAITNKDPVPVTTSEDEFNLTEKALILSYLQDANEFISSDQQVRINEFVALLLSISIESVKSAFQKAHRIKTGTLTSHEAKARVNNLKKILPVFHRLELPEMVSRIESRIKKVQTFIN